MTLSPISVRGEGRRLTSEGDTQEVVKQIPVRRQNKLFFWVKLISQHRPYNSPAPPQLLKILRLFQ